MVSFESSEISPDCSFSSLASSLRQSDASVAEISPADACFVGNSSSLCAHFISKDMIYPLAASLCRHKTVAVTAYTSHSRAIFVHLYLHLMGGCDVDDDFGLISLEIMSTLSNFSHDAQSTMLGLG